MLSQRTTAFIISTISRSGPGAAGGVMLSAQYLSTLRNKPTSPEKTSEPSLFNRIQQLQQQASQLFTTIRPEPHETKSSDSLMSNRFNKI